MTQEQKPSEEAIQLCRLWVRQYLIANPALSGDGDNIDISDFLSIGRWAGVGMAKSYLAGYSAALAAQQKGDPK